jgi:cardiolipin synthase
MRRIEQQYRDVSRELTLDEWLKRPRISQVLDNVMRLTAGLQ